MNTLVSIIVPVYNAEQYIKKCIYSIINQTYNNLEVILVDDGSTDSSSVICDCFSEKYANIKVIHKSNGGTADARNKGLDVIKGEYVTFIDCDDYYEPEAIELLLKATQNGKYLIAHMYSCVINANYEIIKDESNGTKGIITITSEEYIKGMCEKSKSESVCDKLFHISILKERRFLKGRTNEDFLFLAELLFENFVISEIDYSGYNYYQRSGSVTKSGSWKPLIDSIKNPLYLINLAHNEKPVLEPYFARLLLFQVRTLFIVIPWEYIKYNKSEYINSLSAMKRAIYFINESQLSKIDKIFLRMVNIYPKCTIKLVQLLFKIKKL